jgi:hypothetical protein
MGVGGVGKSVGVVVVGLVRVGSVAPTDGCLGEDSTDGKPCEEHAVQRTRI